MSTAVDRVRSVAERSESAPDSGTSKDLIAILTMVLTLCFRCGGTATVVMSKRKAVMPGASPEERKRCGDPVMSHHHRWSKPPSSRDTSHFIASIEKIVFENDIEERLLKFRNS